MDDRQGMDRLVAILDRLREPGGCPWDREQDYDALRGYLLEECYEVAEALDQRDPEALQEELGDLLLQIVFLARIAKERGEFTIEDVIRGIIDKMVRRHPHVFGAETAETAAEVLVNWERIKRGEKEGGDGPRSALDGVPVALPAVLKAHRLGVKAARVGFDWDRSEDVLDKVEEELGELRRAVAEGAPEAIADELGDVMFTLVMLARRTQIDPEAALEATNTKFRRRFGWVEAELERRGVALDAAGIELLEQLWQEAKRNERSPPAPGPTPRP